MAAFVETTNPATGELIGRFARSTPNAVENALQNASECFLQTRYAPIDDRVELFRQLASVLENEAQTATGNIVREMGKPIQQARGEVQKCIELCRYYADNFERLTAPQHVTTEAAASYVRFEPIGPVLGIMPWNFPYWQVFRWGIPTLTTGNVLLLKHADNVLATAEHIADLFKKAGAPAGLFASLCLANDDVKPVIEDRRIRGVSLTGSVRAGRAVAAIAGSAIKPVVLELGGSDPCLILKDADLDRDMDAIVLARFQNSGQTCIAAKRYLVDASIADDFLSRLREKVARLNVGDPLDEITNIGPMARADLRETLASQVERCRNEGLSVIAGGKPIDGPGFYYEPTILTGLNENSLPFREELFGPVASVAVCSTEEQMVDWANATNYGLSANVWTGDAERGEAISHRLEAGVVFVNEPVKSDMRLPFGGIKDSGIGRELGGFGVRQFANAKTVVVRG